MSFSGSELLDPKVRELRDLLLPLLINGNDDPIYGKKAILSSLTINEMDYVYRHPDIFLFDKQIIPEGIWTYCIFRCGRRFGKSWAATAWLAKKIINGARNTGLSSAKHEDVYKTLVPYLASWFPEKWTSFDDKHHVLKFIDGPYMGARVNTFSSELENRGQNLEYIIHDEIGSWCSNNPTKIEEYFEILDTAVSIGENPQSLIISTPKSHPIWWKWQEKIDMGDPRFILQTGNVEDNPFLSKNYKDKLRKMYEDRGAWGRQEYYGDLERDIAGALWTQQMIDDCHAVTEAKLQDMIDDGKVEIVNTVLAIDPALTDGNASDETAMVVAHLDSENKAYVIACEYGHFTPNEWADRANNLFNIHNCNRIVAEKNAGGLLVKNNIHNKYKHIPVFLINARSSKLSRAEYPASLYEQKMVYHLEEFTKLETQMTRYTGNKKEKSPDLMDALVYAIRSLYLPDEQMGYVPPDDSINRLDNLTMRHL